MNTPPLFISYSNVDQYISALREDVREVHEPQIMRLASKKLPPIVSIRCLAILFGFSPQFTGALYKNTEKYYRTFSIPKGKSKRVINAPKVALKVIQKWFGYHLAEVLDYEDCVFGFVKGRSAISGAAVHCGAEWIYSVDIKDFFPSTPIQKISASLQEIGYSEHGADIIAKLCSYKGYLSQGSPASPVLSNLVFKKTDHTLIAIARKYNLRYTRYADDIVFSGKEEIPEGVFNEIKSIVSSDGWTLSEKKERLVKRPNRLKVYGLLVNGDKPCLTKGYRNKIRAFLHMLNTEKIKNDDLARIKGHLSYASAIDRFNIKQESGTFGVGGNNRDGCI